MSEGHRLPFPPREGWPADELAAEPVTPAEPAQAPPAGEEPPFWPPPPGWTPGAAGAPAQDDVFEQIRKLGALRTEGLLTDAEFEAKKTELLARL